MSGATELEPGEVFAGRYEVQRLLGEGDRKRTYLARDKKMDRARRGQLDEQRPDPLRLVSSSLWWPSSR